MDPTVLIQDSFWEDEKAVAMAAPGVEEPVLEGAPPLIFFRTSGSTAVPKWVGLSREALLYSAKMVNAHLEVEASSVWGLALPMHHVGGMGVVARAREAACALEVFPSAWQVYDFADWLEAKRVTHSSLVPAQVHDIVVAGVHAPAGLRALVVGGGSLPDEIGEAARSLGWPVLASYGMTEASSQIATQGFECLAQPFENAPIEPLAHWQLRLEEDGCLAIAGKSLFDGLLVQENGEWHFDAREDEWHRTSDRIQIGDGGLRPLGRSDLYVKVLGELVDLETIEERMLALSSRRLKRRSFVVAGVPDPRAGHLLVPVFDAAVGKAVIEEVLMAHNALAPGLERLQAPVTLYPLPCSELGKPQRAEILAMLAGM